MELKCRLKKQLENSRGFTEALLEDFHTPEQWLHQVTPKSNHALWFAGHLGVADNFFLSIVDPDSAAKHPQFGELFGMGSQPTGDPSRYPPAEEVLAFMRDRRQALLLSLEKMSEADLAQPVPEGGMPMWKDLGGVFETAIWHESMHAGQVSIARRSLGHDPLFKPQGS